MNLQNLLTDFLNKKHEIEDFKDKIKSLESQIFNFSGSQTVHSEWAERLFQRNVELHHSKLGLIARQNELIKIQNNILPYVSELLGIEISFPANPTEGIGRPFNIRINNDEENNLDVDIKYF